LIRHPRGGPLALTSLPSSLALALEEAGGRGLAGEKGGEFPLLGMPLLWIHKPHGLINNVVWRSTPDAKQLLRLQIISLVAPFPISWI